MNFGDIATLISTVGFPIAMCVYMLVTMQKQSENHKDEIDELRKTIENNTLALVKLIEKLDK